MALLPHKMNDREMLQAALDELADRKDKVAAADAVARAITSHLGLSPTKKARFRLVVDVACDGRDGSKVEAALNAAFDTAVSGGVFPKDVARHVRRWQKLVYKLDR